LSPTLSRRDSLTRRDTSPGKTNQSPRRENSPRRETPPRRGADSPKHQAESRSIIEHELRSSAIDQGLERVPVDDKKRKIDAGKISSFVKSSNKLFDQIEIEKRIREEQERRKKAVGAYESMRKITEKTENYE
jgi:hypothetical protein